MVRNRPTPSPPCLSPPARTSPTSRNPRQESSIASSPPSAICISHSPSLRSSLRRTAAAYPCVTGTDHRILGPAAGHRSEEHTSELQSLRHLVCRLLLEKKKRKNTL